MATSEPVRVRVDGRAEEIGMRDIMRALPDSRVYCDAGGICPKNLDVDISFMGNRRSSYTDGIATMVAEALKLRGFHARIRSQMYGYGNEHYVEIEIHG